MNKPSNIRNAALVTALAAVAATAWATNETLETTLPESSYVAAEPTPVLTRSEVIVTHDEPIAVQTETQTVTTRTTYVPVAEPAVTQAPLTIEERRLTLDERIQGDVMDAVLHTPNISGKIGVVSQDAVVTLTGYTVTPGQARRAGQAAGSVLGVRYVQNEIRPRIGGSI